MSKIELPVGFPASFKEGVIRERYDSFPYFYEDAIVEDFKLTNRVVVESGWSSKRIFELFIGNGLSPVLDTKGQITNFYLTENGAIENEKKRDIQSHVISSLMNMGSTQNMSNELKLMGIKFNFPKPATLIKYFIQIIAGHDFVVLDSFAGSGTTAHAVLNLNKEDGGNRKFILIEMEDYANDITAERVKRVMQGYGEDKKAVEGTGGSFDYYELGAPLFHPDNNLNEAVGIAKIREYVWYTETKTTMSDTTPEHPYLLGNHDDTAYYFYYEPDSLTTLHHDFLATVTAPAEQYIIYADNCLLTEEFMIQNRIIFKKIPRDITRF